MNKKLIFDFDGTLVDSMPYFGKGMLSILDKRGVSYPDDLLKIVTPLGYIGTAEYYIQEFALKESKEELIADMTATLLQSYTYDILAKEGVKEKLIALKGMGYSLNVLTASPHSALDVCLKRVGLYELFDNVWSCDDFETTKADAQIYHKVAQRLNTTVENCIFFDDNINAVSVAKKAGMHVIGVYDESSIEYVAEMKKIVEQYIVSFSDLVL